jgi:tritrans,polycis-undecaprenyl-diphosphate synthase [geranylgeranyl-diphosphate specific]
MNIALAYGGRNEIVHAARSVLRDVETGVIRPEDIDISVVEHHIHKGLQLPPVDLMVRTGNEKRTSNFLPWLANGNESAVYFCAPYWPLFRKIDLLRAIRTYDQRMKLSPHLPKRRFLN